MNSPNRSQEGVSVVICCHNSSARLPETLRHLAAQRVRSDTPWELVIVDNASTDGTADAARRLWPAQHPTPLRIIAEPRLGLSHARERAFRVASYELIAFVDDDNWLCEDWVQKAADLMAQHPEAGACGGFSEAVCEITPPAWFDRCNLLYAISPEEWESGDVTSQRVLWGAGLTIRKSAWQELIDNQFQWRLIGRKGASLTAGEDAELCMALRLVGWRLWYDRSLRLKHFLPAGRLTWSYLRRLHRGSGAASPGLDAYAFALREDGTRNKKFKKTWLWQFASVLKNLLARPGKLFRILTSDCEGDSQVLEIEAGIGRFLALLRGVRGYNRGVRMVSETKLRWKKPSVAAAPESDAVLR